MYFRYFVIISPWKSTWPFIWTNLNPHHPKRHSAKFGWNCPSGSGEEDFLNFVNVFFPLFYNYLPMKKGGACIYTNLNPVYPRIYCEKFHRNWPSGSREKDFVNFINVFSQFRNYLHLEKSRDLQTWIPCTQGCIVSSLVEIVSGQWFWRRRFFLFPQCFFCYLVIISSWKRAGPFIWTNFNTLRIHWRKLCAKFVWNWASGSGGEDFFIFINVF